MCGRGKTRPVIVHLGSQVIKQSRDPDIEMWIQGQCGASSKAKQVLPNLAENLDILDCP